MTTDAAAPVPAAGAAVLLDEHVHSIHLSTDHAAIQLIERVAWAVNDAEHAEGRDAAVPRGAAGEGKRADRARGGARERRRRDGAASGRSGAQRSSTLAA
ncbi:MAG TPA: hypothetical protein VL979_09010 [Solirubrobacteraceae bacterium]|nr:hypothetical protein [Solirubrobacteraceae bacterium]